MLENKFKTKVLIGKIKERLPDSMVLHLDPNEIQGIPDLIVLNGKRWGVLEGKKDPDAPFRPNQEYYIDKMNKMSFASAINPDDMEEVLDDLQKALTI